LKIVLSLLERAVRSISMTLVRTFYAEVLVQFPG
jgi:hypothetical protein